MRRKWENSPDIARGKAFWAKRTTSSKAIIRVYPCCVPETAMRPVRVEGSEQKGKCEKEM